MRKSIKVLKKSNSQATPNINKGGNIGSHLSKGMNIGKQALFSTRILNRELTAECLDLKFVKLDQNNDKLKFCDISSIVIKEDESIRNETLAEITLLLTPPIQQRDLRSIEKVGLKYGVRFTKTLFSCPVKSQRIICLGKTSGGKDLKLKHK